MKCLQGWKMPNKVNKQRYLQAQGIEQSQKLLELGILNYLNVKFQFAQAQIQFLKIISKKILLLFFCYGIYGMQVEMTYKLLQGFLNSKHEPIKIASIADKLCEQYPDVNHNSVYLQMKQSQYIMQSLGLCKSTSLQGQYLWAGANGLWEKMAPIIMSRTEEDDRPLQMSEPIRIGRPPGSRMTARSFIFYETCIKDDIKDEKQEYYEYQPKGKIKSSQIKYDFIFRSNMSMQEINQIIHDIIGVKNSHDKRMAQRDFVKIINYGIGLLRIKALDEKRFCPGVSEKLLEEQAKLLEDERMYDKLNVPSMPIKSLTPDFLERFGQGCEGLGRTILVIKVRYLAAQNGVSLMNTANTHASHRYVRFACKQNINTKDNVQGEDDVCDEEMNSGTCPFRINYRSVWSKSMPSQRRPGAVSLIESYSLNGYFPFHNHEIALFQ